MKLGKFEKVDLRNIWKHEQYDFSAWLAKDENLAELSNVIGLTLVDANSEVYVGSYRCDLFAKDETTGTKVIIENQLTNTDHDHLGKIITYVSGLDAEIVVWIVKQVREEHKSAIKWLNEKTTKEIGFFLIELHVYKIGDSVPAPKFEVIEAPNDFIKNTKGGGLDGDLSKSQSERFNFWTKFNEIVIQEKQPFRTGKVSTNHWYNVPIGTSKAIISITLVNKTNSVFVELYIWKNKELFDDLYEKYEEIENNLGFKLEWQRLDNKNAARIKKQIKVLNFDDHQNYPHLMDNIIKTVILLKNEFKKHIK